MRSIKKVLFSILAIFILNIVLIKNFVYADLIFGPTVSTVISYSPLYYIAIIVVITIVVGISIFILRKIYKSNQLQKDEENVKGEKNNDNS